MFLLPKSLGVSSYYVQVVRLLTVTKSVQADYYTVLGAKRDASAKEIKSLYLKKCKEYHPDKNQGNKAMHDKFVKINEAYEVLSDPRKRKDYDHALQNPFSRYQNYSRSPYSWGGNAQSSPQDAWKEQNRWSEEQRSRTSNHEQNYYSKYSARQEWSRRDNLNDYWDHVYGNKNSYDKSSNRERRTSEFERMSRQYDNYIQVNLVRWFIFMVVLVLYTRFTIAYRTHKGRSQVPDSEYPYFDRHYEFKKRNGPKSEDIDRPDVEFEEV